MDERQKRVLTTLIAGSALSLTLGLTASATELGALEQPLDTGIQDNTVQSPAPATEGGNTNEDGSSDEGGSFDEAGSTNEGGNTNEDDGTEEDVEAGVPAEQETVNQQPGQAAACSPAQLSDDGEAASEGKTVVTQGDQSYDLAEETSAGAGWNADSKSGWRYDGNSISMINSAPTIQIRPVTWVRSS